MNAHSRNYQLTADYSIEVETVLSATFVPGCEAWGGGRFERPTNPPEPDSVEDIEVAGLFALKHVRRNGTSTWDRVDLLANIDPNSDAYRQILANVIAFIGEDTAAETLLGEVA